MKSRLEKKLGITIPSILDLEAEIIDLERARSIIPEEKYPIYSPERKESRSPSLASNIYQSAPSTPERSLIDNQIEILEGEKKRVFDIFDTLTSELERLDREQEVVIEDIEEDVKYKQRPQDLMDLLVGEQEQQLRPQNLMDLLVGVQEEPLIRHERKQATTRVEEPPGANLLSDIEVPDLEFEVEHSIGIPSDIINNLNEDAARLGLLQEWIELKNIFLLDRKNIESKLEDKMIEAAKNKTLPMTERKAREKKQREKKVKSKRAILQEQFEARQLAWEQKLALDRENALEHEYYRRMEDEMEELVHNIDIKRESDDKRKNFLVYGIYDRMKEPKYIEIKYLNDKMNDIWGRINQIETKQLEPDEPEPLQIVLSNREFSRFFAELYFSIMNSKNYTTFKQLVSENKNSRAVIEHLLAFSILHPSYLFILTPNEAAGYIELLDSLVRNKQFRGLR
jgi:hypothetical protein